MKNGNILIYAVRNLWRFSHIRFEQQGYIIYGFSGIVAPTSFLDFVHYLHLRTREKIFNNKTCSTDVFLFAF